MRTALVRQIALLVAALFWLVSGAATRSARAEAPDKEIDEVFAAEQSDAPFAERLKRVTAVYGRLGRVADPELIKYLDLRHLSFVMNHVEEIQKLPAQERSEVESWISEQAFRWSKVEEQPEQAKLPHYVSPKLVASQFKFAGTMFYILRSGVAGDLDPDRVKMRSKVSDGDRLRQTLGAELLQRKKIPSSTQMSAMQLMEMGRIGTLAEIRIAGAMDQAHKDEADTPIQKEIKATEQFLSEEQKKTGELERGILIERTRAAKVTDSELKQVGPQANGVPSKEEISVLDKIGTDPKFEKKFLDELKSVKLEERSLEAAEEAVSKGQREAQPQGTVELSEKTKEETKSEETKSEKPQLASEEKKAKEEEKPKAPDALTLQKAEQKKVETQQDLKKQLEASKIKSVTKGENQKAEEAKQETKQGGAQKGGDQKGGTQQGGEQKNGAQQGGTQKGDAKQGAGQKGDGTQQGGTQKGDKGTQQGDDQKGGAQQKGDKGTQQSDEKGAPNGNQPSGTKDGQGSKAQKQDDDPEKLHPPDALNYGDKAMEKGEKLSENIVARLTPKVGHVPTSHMFMTEVAEKSSPWGFSKDPDTIAFPLAPYDERWQLVVSQALVPGKNRILIPDGGAIDPSSFKNPPQWDPEMGSYVVDSKDTVSRDGVFVYQVSIKLADSPRPPASQLKEYENELRKRASYYQDTGGLTRHDIPPEVVAMVEKIFKDSEKKSAEELDYSLTELAMMVRELADPSLEKDMRPALVNKTKALACNWVSKGQGLFACTRFSKGALIEKPFCVCGGYTDIYLYLPRTLVKDKRILASRRVAGYDSHGPEIREGGAHTWPQVYIEGRGWRPLEPTNKIPGGQQPGPTSAPREAPRDTRDATEEKTRQFFPKPEEVLPYTNSPERMNLTEDNIRDVDWDSMVRLSRASALNHGDIPLPPDGGQELKDILTLLNLSGANGVNRIEPLIKGLKFLSQVKLDYQHNYDFFYRARTAIARALSRWDVRNINNRIVPSTPPTDAQVRELAQALAKVANSSLLRRGSTVEPQEYLGVWQYVISEYKGRPSLTSELCDMYETAFQSTIRMTVTWNNLTTILEQYETGCPDRFYAKYYEHYEQLWAIARTEFSGAISAPLFRDYYRVQAFNFSTRAKHELPREYFDGLLRYLKKDHPHVFDPIMPMIIRSMSCTEDPAVTAEIESYVAKALQSATNSTDPNPGYMEHISSVRSTLLQTIKLTESPKLVKLAIAKFTDSRSDLSEKLDGSQMAQLVWLATSLPPEEFAEAHKKILSLDKAHSDLALDKWFSKALSESPGGVGWNLGNKEDPYPYLKAFRDDYRQAYPTRDQDPFSTQFLRGVAKIPYMQKEYDTFQSKDLSPFSLPRLLIIPDEGQRTDPHSGYTTLNAFDHDPIIGNYGAFMSLRMSNFPDTLRWSPKNAELGLYDQKLQSIGYVPSSVHVAFARKLLAWVSDPKQPWPEKDYGFIRRFLIATQNKLKEVEWTDAERAAIKKLMPPYFWPGVEWSGMKVSELNDEQMRDLLKNTSEATEPYRTMVLDHYLDKFREKSQQPSIADSVIKVFGKLLPKDAQEKPEDKAAKEAAKKAADLETQREAALVYSVLRDGLERDLREGGKEFLEKTAGQDDPLVEHIFKLNELEKDLSLDQLREAYEGGKWIDKDKGVSLMDHKVLETIQTLLKKKLVIPARTLGEEDSSAKLKDTAACLDEQFLMGSAADPVLRLQHLVDVIVQLPYLAPQTGAAEGPEDSARRARLEGLIKEISRQLGTLPQNNAAFYDRTAKALWDALKRTKPENLYEPAIQGFFLNELKNHYEKGTAEDRARFRAIILEDLDPKVYHKETDSTVHALIAAQVIIDSPESKKDINWLKDQGKLAAYLDSQLPAVSRDSLHMLPLSSLWVKQVRNTLSFSAGDGPSGIEDAKAQRETMTVLLNGVAHMKRKTSGTLTEIYRDEVQDGSTKEHAGFSDAEVDSFKKDMNRWFSRYLVQLEERQLFSQNYGGKYDRQTKNYFATLAQMDRFKENDVRCFLELRKGGRCSLDRSAQDILSNLFDGVADTVSRDAEAQDIARGADEVVQVMGLKPEQVPYEAFFKAALERGRRK